MSRVPRSYAELCALPAPVPTHVVEFLADEPRFRIKQGDQFTAHVYCLDPSAKWTLVARVGDGFDPECNAYRSQVKVVRKL